MHASHHDRSEGGSRKSSRKRGRVSFRSRVLPWSSSSDDDARFRRIAEKVLISCAIFFLLMPWLPVRKPDPKAPPVVSASMKVLLAQETQKPKPPPPPPQKVAKAEIPKAPPVEQKVAVNDKRPEPPKPKRADPLPKSDNTKEAPVPEARQPIENKPPGEIGIRQRVAGIGLLANSKELTEMHGAPIAVQLAPVKQGPGVGTGVGVGVGAGNEAGVPVRAMITSNATTGSGGINTAGYSTNTGGGGLAGRATTMVEGMIGGGGGGGAGGGGGSRTGTGLGGGGGGGGGAGGTATKGDGGKASRAIEDVRLVFERNKGSIYAIYNRALREEPGLQGKVVLKLTIAPSGQVTALTIVSSELKMPDVEDKLLARIRTFDFGAKDVNVMVVNYPLDFLPS
ncbi:MAG TPA: AgmX/PglI C-terminal domain-containing protein [Caldimonas sp.]|nr:AgmX/PglI C-terminal domain-containing protein [Caldimonas sp.]HEX4234189.1 AgmX/PglI C-terminal domain-containing protein [Caldimonas sp.]